jgi:hypothetical protein
MRTAVIWTPECWEAGYIGDGYFRVYRPDYPKSWVSGYAKRCNVVYWLETGHVVDTPKEEIHHINGIKLDDRFENLQLLSHSEHSHLENPKTFLICWTCGRSFPLPYKRVKSKRRFCSLACRRITKAYRIWQKGQKT